MNNIYGSPQPTLWQAVTALQLAWHAVLHCVLLDPLCKLLGSWRGVHKIGPCPENKA